MVSLKEHSLEPWLFLLYIKDFWENMKGEKVVEFAKDTCIISHSKTDQELLSIIDSIFKQLIYSMKPSSLTVNRDNSEVNVFFPKR